MCNATQICLNLKPPTVQATALAKTSRQFAAVSNAVGAYGWQQRQKNGIHCIMHCPIR